MLFLVWMELVEPNQMAKSISNYGTELLIAEVIVHVHLAGGELLSELFPKPKVPFIPQDAT